ncbi:MBL fold metallo-hydrolase [Acidisphaera sp. S103]|uniref:MBL fold metallo-hydrolase n=1 Tax=Acidisphaera sp. S103 TaxID=1747223 RepID=UPI00131AF3AE|nr:MBL fold metallo-hydrolase [Acidisphaera sp. S103]
MFHEFRIGAMQATIVSDGPLSLPAATKIFKGTTIESIDAALTEAGLPDDRVQVEQNCLLLETGGKRALFDNGLGSQKLYGSDSGKLLGSLRQAGIDPASIDALVLTHAHSDHCWGTMGDDGTPNFPNATLYLAQEELDFWTSDPPSERLERSVAGFEKHILPLRDRIRFIRDGEEFLPGVQAWLTPGHTPGHMAYLFDGGWCLIGDVAFHDPLSYRFPEAESLFDTDRTIGIATRRRVLDRLANDRLSIVGYHQPWPGLGRVERAGTSFRWVADGAAAR